MSILEFKPILRGCFALLLAVTFVLSPGITGSANGQHPSFTFTPATPNEDYPPRSYSPLEITALSASGEPLVGQVVTLHVEVQSGNDEPNTTLEIQLPKGVKLVEGDLTWKGSLTANQPQAHEVSVCVLYEGDWMIYVAAWSPITTTVANSDHATVHFIASTDGARVVPGSQYAASPFQDRSHFVPDQITNAVHIDPDTPTGIVIIAGQIRYQAQSRDMVGGIPGYVINVLPRVKIEVWDDTGSVPMATTYSGASGSYSVTVPNSEPGGIDPRLRVYATDDGNPAGGSRVQVRETADLYVWFANTEVINGGNLADGTYDFNPEFNEGNSGFDAVQAFYIFDLTANQAYQKLQGWVPWDEGHSVNVRWPKKCVEEFGGQGSCFIGMILIDQPDGNVPDYILHEYGHFVLSEKVDQSQIILACLAVGFQHRFWGETVPSCAWSEGWASFFEMAVQDDADYVGGPVEDIEWLLSNGLGDPSSYEAIVAATLWDFYDSANEAPHDFFSDGFDGPNHNGIWFFSTHGTGGLPPPLRLGDFWYVGWKIARPLNACYGSLILQHHKLAWAPFMYPLEIHLNPANAGLVNRSPEPACPNDTYTQDTLVTLTARSNRGYTFSNWFGALWSTANPVSLLMDEAKSLSANFLAATAIPTRTPTRTRTPTPTGPTPTRTRTPVPNPTRTRTPTRTATLLPGTDPYQVFLGEPQSGIVIQPGQFVTASGLNQPFQPNAITLARTTGLGPVGPFWYHNGGHASQTNPGMGVDIQFASEGTLVGGYYSCVVNGTVYAGVHTGWTKLVISDPVSNQITWDCYLWFQTAGMNYQSHAGNYTVAPYYSLWDNGPFEWSFVYHKDGSAGTPTSTPCPPGGPCPDGIQP